MLKKEDWQPEFKDSEEIVWIIYYSLIINLTVILFPYVALIQPVLIFLVFNAYYYYLVIAAKKPVPSSNKDNTGTIITGLSSASFLIWLAISIVLMIVRVRHEKWLSDNESLCGPIEDQTTF